MSWRKKDPSSNRSLTTLYDEWGRPEEAERWWKAAGP